MLRACHRVLRPGGRAAFYVIHVRPGIAAAARDEAMETFPGFLETREPYPEMLIRAGFEEVSSTDVTPEYHDTARRWMVAAEDLEGELRFALGDEVLDEKAANRRRALAEIEAGHVQRSLLWARA